MKNSYQWLIITALFLGCNSKPNKETTKAKISDITEYVYASAKVVPINTYNSRTLKSGIINDIFVKNGDAVKKGEALFSINVTADIKVRLDNATIELEEAKNNLSGENNRLVSIELEIQRVKDKNQIDSINYHRRKKLWDQNIGSKNVLEQAMLVYESSKSRLATLKSEYHLTKSSLESMYKKAENRVNTERNLLDDLVIKSEIDGIVFSITKEVGEIISPQEIFSEIGSLDNYKIELDIDEVDISRVELGDTTIILLEAYPDKVFTSTIVYISMLKDEMTQTFNVECIFDNRPEKLFSGLAGEANILVDRRKDALVVPSAFIVDGNKVLTENGLIDIRIGVKSIEYVEILGGIDTTTILLIPDVQ